MPHNRLPIHDDPEFFPGKNGEYELTFNIKIFEFYS